MSSRRGQSMPAVSYGGKATRTRGRCMAFICVTWKILTCILSHVTLVTTVVSYCLLGAFTFEKLEAENERMVKQGIGTIRGNVVEDIWRMTSRTSVLHQTNWTSTVVAKLLAFETDLLTAMKSKGWDGTEDESQTQWTFAGALFYSIIVITTIGYGHIAPKTSMGKVTTIFYAILGIPLMLLCLSNIGDIMASSFRFLYWRVCCFLCTREPKRPHSRRGRGRNGGRQSQRYSSRSQPPMRRSLRVSQRSADSGIEPYEPGMSHAYSDTELRYDHTARHDREWDRGGIAGGGGAQYKRTNRHNKDRERERERYRERHTLERERYVRDRFDDLPQPQPQSGQFRSAGRRSVRENHQRDHTRPREMPEGRATMPRTGERNRPARMQGQGARAQSLDPRRPRRDALDLDTVQEPRSNDAPVLCNRYAIDELDRRRTKRDTPNYGRSQSMPRPSTNQVSPPAVHYGDRLEPPGWHHGPKSRHTDTGRHPDDDTNGYDVEMQPTRRSRRREKTVVPPPPSPRIMSPMGLAVNRQARHIAAVLDDDSVYGDDDWGPNSENMPTRARPVPIWLCIFLVISYIIAGAYLFSQWEEWSWLDSVYFCFITLTTIGFGDFVPAQGVKTNSQMSIALCSLYLLFGIALLAMSFNLVQEEFIANVKSVARRLGILKEEENDE